MKVDDDGGVAIAAGGAYGLATEGVGGIVSGAQAGLQVKETVGEATAFAINQIVDVATERYVNSAKTPQERSQFQNAINFFKNSSLSVFGLLGMRHFVKPGPVGKAYSTALRKSLESKAVVKDGVVYVGKKNVGRIEDMPTIRTFKQPTDVALRPEFQSNIFDREVMYQGAGTGYNYRVYQRNDIDWGLVRTKGSEKFVGKTNFEAAQHGLAPQLSDGSFVNLHHVGQNGRGPLAEASTNNHTKSLHSQYGYGNSHPNFPVDHGPQWRKDTMQYWQNRIKGAK